MKKFFLTTPIYYPNARPHVGSAYTTIVCDVLARYKHMCGYDVAFLTGTDEHGEKLERAAAAAGVSPQEFVAEKRKLFVQLWEKLGIPVTVYPEAQSDSLRFIYTTHPDHEKSVQRMLLRAKRYPLRYCAHCDLYVHGAAPPNCPQCNGTLESRPVIYKRQYQGRYCVSDERYISDGTDPVNCDICGRPAELISEENYFFRLSAFENLLLKLYDRPGFVQPDYRRNEVLSFVKGGLRDISVSRKRIKWGIPWPDDPDQVFYVWYDALTSYLTGIGFAQGENGGPDFQKYWMDPDAEVVHMLGKDILRFHAVYWPAFLMAADLPLPKTIFAHGWIYYEQDKMSKSKGNVVYPEPIVDALGSFDAPGNDALRYYLLREAPFGQDMSFSYEGLIQRYNSDLANDLGNLANRTIKMADTFENLIGRTMTMMNRHFAGEVPKPIPGASVEEALGGEPPEAEIVELAAETQRIWRASLENFDFPRGLDAAWVFIGRINKYLVEQQPWTELRQFEAAKGQYVTTEPKHLRAVLYTTAAALRLIAVLLYPILPQACRKLWQQLSQPGDVADQKIESFRFEDLRPGTKLGAPEPIFPRLDKAATLQRLEEFAEADSHRDKPKEALKPVESETAKGPEPSTAPGPQSATPSPQPAAASPATISIEDFAKVDMRVGQIVAAERVEGATKLLKLSVDIGTEVRQVVAGIATAYAPEQLVGMKVILVTNLQPRKLRGVESNGMIVAASVGPEGKPVLATFKEDVPNGARLK